MSSKKALLKPFVFVSAGLTVGVTYAFVRKYMSDKYLDADNISQYVSFNSNDDEFISVQTV